MRHATGDVFLILWDCVYLLLIRVNSGIPII